MLVAEIISEKFLVVTSAIKITPITDNQQVRENTQSDKYSLPQIKKVLSV